GGGPGNSGGPGGDFATRVMNNDKNNDGKVTRDELPEPMQRIFEQADQNQDGAIDKTEAEQMAARLRQGGGRPGFGGPGGQPPGDAPQRPRPQGDGGDVPARPRPDQ
ncbi:MAG: hypothetical protein AB1705_19150, partial [Verrucomicrobiota bacterium]